MKVITQLVQHFWSRQALTPAQAEYLVNQGFVRAVDLPGLEMSVPSEKQPSSFKFKKPMPPPHRHEADQERLESQGPSKRRRTGKAKVKTQTEKELAKSVASLLDRRATQLGSFRRWALPLGPAEDWVAAAVNVRQSSEDRLVDTLAKGLRKQSVTFGELWEALDVEPLHALADGPDARGPVPRAFRLLLTTDGPLPASYAFLLKEEPLAAAKSLATAHRRIVGSFAALLDRYAKIVTTALQNGSHPVVFWALALLYNSRRKPMNAPLRPAREYGPLPLPSADIWRQAWTAALSMNEPQVAQLLVACYQNEQDQSKREPVVCTFPLHCPIAWRAPS